MRLKKGSYWFDANSVAIATSAELIRNEGGQPIKVRKEITFDGYLNADGQAAIAQACSALQTALAKPFEDVTLYRDDGVASDSKLTNADSLTGVICQPARFPDAKGGEYSTFRHFQFTASAEYPAANSKTLLVSFEEEVRFSGGGRRRRCRESLNTLPQAQIVRKFTIFRAVQSGTAVGFRARPTPPQPLWPDALVESPDTAKKSPDRRGRDVASPQYENYRITWSYTFESPTPLSGEPNVWRG